eukprot:NODE_26_length_35450_cov_0.398320.p4 type:complete len:545 gc:universal NODE_26_length_35450_cov_0.398320:25720-24086(-)
MSELPSPLSDNSNAQSPLLSTSSQLLRRSTYYIPILGWIKEYNRAKFGHDLVAAITLTCILIPQIISYTVTLAKVPIVVGLKSTIFPLFIYAIMGSSHSLSVGLDAVVCILIGQYKHENSIAFMCGVITFLLGILRFGFLDAIFSRPIIAGLISGVAVTICIEQIPFILGLIVVHCNSPLELLFHELNRLYTLHIQTFLLSCFSLLFMIMYSILSRFVNLQIPVIIPLVVVSIFSSFIFDFKSYGVAIVGEIEIHSDLLKIQLPINGVPIRTLIGPSGVITVIGFLESMLASKSFAAVKGYAISRNRELVALGLTNLVGSLFGCMPVYGSLARSMISHKAKVETPLCQVFVAFLVLTSTLVLLPIFRYLPLATTACVVMNAAINLIERQKIGFLIKIHAWTDLVISLIVFVTTLTISIEYGALISIVIALLLNVKNTTTPKISILGRKSGTHNEYVQMTEFPDDVEQVDGALLLQIDESLNFANSAEMMERVRRLEWFGHMQHHPSDHPSQSPIHHVIFDLGNMLKIDSTYFISNLELWKYYSK